jgi:5'-nucleotidase
VSALKNLTIIHSNDIHGDFLPEERGGVQVGGISLLSGYIQAERARNHNAIFAFAGDILQGSLIDSDYRGVSSIELMNIVRPDIACLGNHEFDYGLTHLLFLERCAAYPIVSANLYIKKPYTRLFTPCKVIKRDGMRIMFIGIITAETLASIKDPLIGTLVDIEDAAQEVGRICNRYREADIDLTVVLSHIGFEEDLKLAELLDPAWGVDAIIGAHTHTLMDQPSVVNDILVAQAGSGTDQVGRFDLVIDTDTNSIHEWKWQCIPITSETSQPDVVLDEVVAHYRDATDEKYNRILTRLDRQATHPDRYQETEVGDLFADMYADAFPADIALVGSGSLRQPALGPLVTVGNALAMASFGGIVYRLKVTGAKVKRAFRHVLREEAFQEGSHTEFFQFSSRLAITWSRTDSDFASITFDGEPLDDNQLYCLAIEDYHYRNTETSLGMSLSELTDEKIVILATEVKDVILEWFAEQPSVTVPTLGRLQVT